MQSAAFAFLAGFIPALIWLIFWLLEDRRRPEPERMILRAFAAGMVAVPLVIPFQQAAAYWANGPMLVFIWAATEEMMKLIVALVAVLRKRAVDEPIDIPVYLITVALGFSALENMLFLLHPSGGVVNELITGNLRFIGATLIHTLSSAVVGGMLALAFYRDWFSKIAYGLLGVILAVFLHGLFNFSILTVGADHLLTVFAFVWIGIVFLLLALERVKLLKRPAWWEKMFINRKRSS